MSERFSTHFLTADEAGRFDRDGFLVVPDAVGGDRLRQLDDLVTALGDIYHRAAIAPARRLFGGRRDPFPHGVRPVSLGAGVEFHDVVRVPAVQALLDHEVLLPKVAGVLGWNIFTYLATTVVSPPQVVAGGTRAIAEHVAAGWHQDSSRVNDDLDDEPRPRLSVKVAYFLNDLSAAGGGNMWIVPGSHRSNERPADVARTGVPLCVPAGTAVLFDRRLWHSASPNAGAQSRRVVFVGYAHRWLRPHDDMDVASLWAAATPLRRQLLGFGQDATSHYSPDAADVPLRELVEAARAARAAVPSTVA